MTLDEFRLLQVGDIIKAPNYKEAIIFVVTETNRKHNDGFIILKNPIGNKKLYTCVYLDIVANYPQNYNLWRLLIRAKK